MEQATALMLLKRFDTSTSCMRPRLGSKEKLYLVAFADAGHSDAARQLCYIVGLVVGPVQKDSLSHFLTRASHKSKRRLRSTTAAEIISAEEALEEVALIEQAFEFIYGVEIKLVVLVDTKELYQCMSTQRNETENPGRGDFNTIRYNYETLVDVFGWIKGSCNPADIGTKKNSALA